jgi:GNAT superfamily N-acetyltransferase
VSEYIVRPARKDDLDRVTELALALQDHLEACGPELWRMNAQTRANLKGQLAGRLKAPHTCVLVAEHKHDGVVGVIFGRVVANRSYIPARAGLVDQAFVSEKHRRRGVGRLLMAELCHFFAREEVEDLSLRYVVGNEEASAFWTALGFAPRIVTAGACRQEVQARIRATQGQ